MQKEHSLDLKAFLVQSNRGSSSRSGGRRTETTPKGLKQKIQKITTTPHFSNQIPVIIILREAPRLLTIVPPLSDFFPPDKLFLQSASALLGLQPSSPRRTIPERRLLLPCCFYAPHRVAQRHNLQAIVHAAGCRPPPIFTDLQQAAVATQRINKQNRLNFSELQKSESVVQHVGTVPFNMRTIVAATLAFAAIIISLPPPCAAAPHARLISSSEAFPSKASPDRLHESSLPLQPAPQPGRSAPIMLRLKLHTPNLFRYPAHRCRPRSPLPNPLGVRRRDHRRCCARASP